MKVLVVHDRDAIRAQIVALCGEVLGAGSEIHSAADYVSARNSLSTNVYDVAIIDLTLPHIAGDEASMEVAENLLKELIDFGHLYAPGDILGITREVEVLSLIENTIGRHLMSIIDERAPAGWARLLEDRLRYVVKTRAARARSINRHYDFDVCVVTALDEELEPFRRIFELSEEQDVRVPGVLSFTFTDKNSQVRQGAVYPVGRAGQASAASGAQVMINAYRPRYVIMAGICGGVKGKVRIGDAVLFDAAMDWDYGKWKREKGKLVFNSRPSPVTIRDLPIHMTLRKFLQTESPTRKFGIEQWLMEHPEMKEAPNIYLGPAASGSAVIGSQEIIDRIRGLNDAIIAVDMESYGVYVACKTTNVVKPEFFCLKTVSDYCNGSKNDRFHGACADLSAMLVGELVKKWLEYE